VGAARFSFAGADAVGESGFIFLFTVGGVNRRPKLAQFAGLGTLDARHLLVVAHSHYVLSLGAVFAESRGGGKLLGFFPKMTGFYNVFAFIGAHPIFLGQPSSGVNLVFFPQHFFPRPLPGMPAPLYRLPRRLSPAGTWCRLRLYKSRRFGVVW